MAIHHIKAPVTKLELLAVHRSYLSLVAPLLDHSGLHALAHITGGGLTDNLPRVLPERTHAEIKLGTWEIPPVFHLLQEHGEVSSEEMLRVFNMGIGMVLVVAQDSLKEILGAFREAGEKGTIIGSVGRAGCSGLSPERLPGHARLRGSVPAEDAHPFPHRRADFRSDQAGIR